MELLLPRYTVSFYSFFLLAGILGMPSTWSRLKQRIESLTLHFKDQSAPPHSPALMASNNSDPFHQHDTTGCCHHSDDVGPTKVTQKPSEPPFHTSFLLFPQLLPEIRAKIWSLTLPGPRVLHVRSSTNSPALSGEYTTSPISYGGRHPVALHVCRESRGEALRTLTPKFTAFWDLKQDTLYVEVKKWGANDAMKMVADMRTRGLLDNFKHVALDFAIWGSVTPEHCMTTLVRLHNITTMHLILRARDWHKDILNPGVAWWMVPVESPEQTEFKTHESWCRQVQRFRKTSEEFMEGHLKTFQTQWEGRMEAGPQPVVTINVIEGRMMEELPFSTRRYEPPGMDFFG